MTADTLIEDLGGTFVVAQALGVAPPVVSNWRARGKIPGEWWSKIATLAADRGLKGITTDLLAGMHSKRPAEVRP